MQKIQKLVLFDIDGTLIQSKGAARAAKAQAIEDVYHMDVDLSTLHFGGKTDWQILREALGSYGVSSAEIGEKMPQYERAFAKRLSDKISEFEITPCPGAMEVVQHLDQREDVLVGLVTGNTSLTAPVKLNAAGFSMQMFPIGAYGSEAESRNDLPRIALERANSLAQASLQAQDMIVIGDTVADVACARAVGAVAVTVFTGYEERDKLIHAAPDYVLDDLTQFLDQVPI